MRVKIIVTICLPVLLLYAAGGFAQSMLGSPVHLTLDRKPLDSAFRLLGKQTGVRFSFNSSIIPMDSLVSISARGELLGVLEKLMGPAYEFRQSGSFVVIRYAPGTLSMIVQESRGTAEEYQVSGIISDARTGAAVKEASIVEKNLLTSTLTDSKGHFSIRLKKASGTIMLSVSKEKYREITSMFLSDVTVVPGKGKQQENFSGLLLSKLEQTGAGKFLIPRSQRLQSRNLPGFIAGAPAQIALIPTLSTHGQLSGQVINNFSLNITGAYNAGVSGTEIGLLFNLDNTQVRYLQVAGAFNLVGGQVRGLQVAGLVNRNLSGISGVQVALGLNANSGPINGLQIGGLINRSGKGSAGLLVSLGANLTDSAFRGMQIGGLLNNLKGGLQGVQVSLGLNNASKVQGMQIGLVNHTAQNRGFQLGLVNISDDSGGGGLGLINIYPKGVHRLRVSANESFDANLAIETGNRKLYTALLLGRGLGSEKPVSAFGLGIGRSLSIGKNLEVEPMLSGRYVYQGAWESKNLLLRVEFSLALKITSWLSIYAGPAFNLYYSDQHESVAGFGRLTEGRKPIGPGANIFCWPGWSAGFRVF